MKPSREWQRWPIGARVLVLEYAWAGKTGTIVRYDRGPADLGKRYGVVPVVRIDGIGAEIFIWEPRYIRPEGWRPADLPAARSVHDCV